MKISKLLFFAAASETRKKRLTPEQFDRFGASPHDFERVRAWWSLKGLTIEHRTRASNSIGFSGAAGQVGRALARGAQQYG